MFNTPKVLLTINLEGATLVRKSTETPFTYKKIAEIKGREVLLEKGTHFHKELVTKPAKKVITISKGCYLHLISMESRPTQSCYQKWYKNWPKMTPKERLEAHMFIFCSHERGISYSYKILEN